MIDIDLENKSVNEILEISFERSHKAYKVGIEEYERWHAEEYEYFFKAIAKKDTGAILRWDRPDSYKCYTAEDFCKENGLNAPKFALSGQRMIINQALWLVEIGKEDVAEKWLDDIQEVSRFCLEVVRYTKENLAMPPVCQMEP